MSITGQMVNWPLFWEYVGGAAVIYGTGVATLTAVVRVLRLARRK